MTVQWFVLDSLHADYASVLAALATTTAAKYAGTVNQGIRDASHNANIKLVSSNIEDGERVGVLAPLARSNYGIGIYKDEYPDQDTLDVDGFNLLGESERSARSVAGRQSLHYDQPYTPDGSWVWSSPALPDSSGDGHTYGDRIVGYPTENGPFSTVTPPTSLTDCWFHGFHIAAWYGNFDGRTIAGFASMKLYNGAAPDNKLTMRFNHWLKPGAISEGEVLQHGHAWIKDPGSNAYSIIEGSSSHNTANGTGYRFYDPNYDTLEFTGELPPTPDAATCQATPGTSFFDSTMDGGQGGWWAHMPDGSDPTGRVVGTGNFGFRFNYTAQSAAETVRENIAYHGLKIRFGSENYTPSTNPVGVKTIQHIDYHMLNMLYTSGSQNGRLFTIFPQGRGADTLIQDILINVDQVGDGANAFYLVNQDGSIDSGRVQRVTLQADVAARDGRENIFDIGGRPWQENSDSHAVGIQMSNDITVQYLKTRRCGGHIVIYVRNWIADGMTSTNRPVENILIANNDVAEHSAAFITGGSNAVGIAANNDNNYAYPNTNIVIRNNLVRGYDTIPGRAFTSCIRNILPDQVSLLGNDCDLAALTQLDLAKNISQKWIDLAGSTGNWSIDDFFEDGANPGVKLGRVVKVETPGATPRLFYVNATSQTGNSAAIASGVTINNLTDTGTGVTSAANGSRGLGPNTLIGQGAARNRFGNSNGTALWMRQVTGAPLGGPDPLDRLSGGAYLDESDTDYVGATAYLGFDITGIGNVDFATYAATVTQGNSYGVNSQVVP